VDKVLFIIPVKINSFQFNPVFKKITGFNFLHYKINACLKSKLGPVIVSTNSTKVAKLALKYGASPLLRNKKYNSSKATMMSIILHTLRELQNKITIPKFIAVLIVNSFFLKSETIIKAYKIIKNKKKINTVHAYSKLDGHPFHAVIGKSKLKYNSIKINKSSMLDFERSRDWPEINYCSCALRLSKFSYFKKYLKNKNINFKKFIIDTNSSYGVKCTRLETFEIKNENDLKLAKFLFKKKIWSY
jgi:CMP-N-acetylneuraminic acid synthetase